MAQGERFIPRINGYAIDAVTSETHSRESEVTHVPVEDGSDVTDNNKPKNRMVTIEGIVTNTPSGDMLVERADFFNVFGELGQTVPTQAFIDMIDEAQAKSETITVETELRSYARMSITKFEVPRDKDTGFAQKFTLVCEEQRIRKTNRFTVRLLVAAVHVSAKKKVGAKATTSKSNIVTKADIARGAADTHYDNYKAMGGKKNVDDFTTEVIDNMVKKEGPAAAYSPQAKALIKENIKVKDNATNEKIDEATDNSYIKAVSPLGSYLFNKAAHMGFGFGQDERDDD